MSGFGITTGPINGFITTRQFTCKCHVDVALVIMRAVSQRGDGQINKWSRGREGQWANSNHLIEFALQAPKTITVHKKEKQAGCRTQAAALTFRRDAVDFGPRGVILIGCGQLALVGACVLLTRNRGARRRQRKYFNVFLLHGNILLVAAGSLVAWVPPPLVGARCWSPPLRCGALSPPVLKGWRRQGLLKQGMNE